MTNTERALAVAQAALALAVEVLERAESTGDPDARIAAARYVLVYLQNRQRLIAEELNAPGPAA